MAQGRGWPKAGYLPLCFIPNRRSEYNVSQWVLLLPEICEKNQKGNLRLSEDFFHIEKYDSFEIRF